MMSRSVSLPDAAKQIHADNKNHYCNHFSRETVYKYQVTRSLAA